MSNTSTALEKSNGHHADMALEDARAFMPVMETDDVLKRHAALLQFRENVMREGVDYGKIPGTGDKPTLLKPGAEKMCTLFGLTTRFEVVQQVEDWTGAGYNGEPFFYYWYRCSLWRGARLIAEADGSCNSREVKYRYRKSERACPQCGQATIIKGKAEYGGGWICFAKKGGCGAKFKAGDAAIEDQLVGRVANPDIADQVNTLQKMAQKRALVAATLIGVNASEFFTQDIEDFAHGDADYHVETTVVETTVVEPVTERATEEELQDANAIRLAAIDKGYVTEKGTAPNEVTADLPRRVVLERSKKWERFVEQAVAQEAQDRLATDKASDAAARDTAHEPPVDTSSSPEQPGAQPAAAETVVA